jgi:hypothetical protein
VRLPSAPLCARSDLPSYDAIATGDDLLDLPTGLNSLSKRLDPCQYTPRASLGGHLCFALTLIVRPSEEKRVDRSNASVTLQAPYASVSDPIDV